MTKNKLNWEHALESLGGQYRDCTYACGLDFVTGCIMYLKKRYDSGERTQELYDLMTGEYYTPGFGYSDFEDPS